MTNIYGQISYQLVLKSNCPDSITNFSFDVYDYNNDELHYSDERMINLQDSGFYSLSVYMREGDFIKSFSFPIVIGDYKSRVDTVIVPKILFVTENALHSSYWNYYYCNEVCNGLVKDYYPNGNVSQEGEFLNGKPYWIKEYREDGTIETKTDYKVGSLQYERVNYYDGKGKLEEYEVYSIKKRKTVKIVYDSDGNKIEREIIKHNIVYK